MPVAEKHIERNTEITKLYQQGVSGTKLAKKFKLSISQAYRVINSKKAKKTKKR